MSQVSSSEISSVSSSSRVPAAAPMAESSRLTLSRLVPIAESSGVRHMSMPPLTPQTWPVM
jgi:hypothetical protein